jgi:hypothetical protein
MARRARKTPGEMAFLWLDGVRVKHNHWVGGSLRHRDKFEAWSNYLLNGLRSADFLTALESETDAWNRAKTVGQKVSELAANYRKLSDEQKAELAQETEVELKTGAKLLSQEKKEILEVVAAAADP